jgi:hypothetical protein
VFDKSKSVFKDWKLDKSKLIKEGLIDEVAYWNVPNFVKDEEEVAKITKAMEKEAEFLKTLFIIKCAHSYFPVLRQLNFGQMIHEWPGVIAPNFEIATVDRIFIAVTKNMNKALSG